MQVLKQRGFWICMSRVCVAECIIPLTHGCFSLYFLFHFLAPDFDHLVCLPQIFSADHRPTRARRRSAASRRRTVRLRASAPRSRGRQSHHCSAESIDRYFRRIYLIGRRYFLVRIVGGYFRIERRALQHGRFRQVVLRRRRSAAARARRADPRAPARAASIGRTKICC